MNKYNTKQIIFFSVLAIALIDVFVESFLYFNGEGGAISEIIYLSIANTSLTFGFEVLLMPSDIFENNMSLRNILYSFSLSILPFFAISAMFKAFEFIIKKKLVYLKNKEIILIFGYNNNVKSLISDNKDKVFYIFSDSDELINTANVLMKNNIIPCTDDFTSDPFTTLLNYISVKKLNKVKSIFLFEKSTLDNITIYLDILSNIPNDTSNNTYNNTKLTVKGFDFYFSSESDGLENFIHKIHNYDIGKSNDISIVDINHLKLVNLFNKTPICTWNIQKFEKYNNENGNKWEFHKYNKEFHDVHVLLVGLNNFGQEAIKHIINNSIIHYDNTIIIDVIDNDLASNKTKFLNNFRDDNVLKNIYDNNDFFEKDIDLDGKLKINFYDEDLVSVKLLEDLVDQNNPFTYIVICEDDTNKNMVNMITINDFLKYEFSNHLPPVAVKINNKLEFNENNKNIFDDNIVFIEPSSEIINLEKIINKEFLSNLTSYNSCYDHLYSMFSKLFSGNDKTYVFNINEFWGNINNYDVSQRDENWNKLDFYRKESNRYLCYNEVSKDILVKKYFENNAKGQNEDYLEAFKEVISSWLTDMYNIKSSSDNNNMISTLIEHEKYPQYVKLYNLFASEHRRWNYFVLMQKWKYGESKINDMRITNYLISYNSLCTNTNKNNGKNTNTAEVACYDLLAYMLLLKNID